MPAGDSTTHHVLILADSSRMYCTCTLRRRPCLHALALQEWYRRTGDAAFPETPVLPDWAQTLLQQPFPGGRNRVQTDLARTAAARQRRFDERLERAAGGLEELETWLKDTIRRGLATAVSEDPLFWQTAATRMADASLPGLARGLRRMELLRPDQNDWPEQIAGVLARLYLAVRSFRRREQLPDALMADLLNVLGISLKKEEVLQTGVRKRDIWAVTGICEELLEDRLWQRRCWLLGAGGDVALLLDHAFGDAAFPPGFRTGDLLEGELAYYPSAFPQRALAVSEFKVLERKMARLPGFVSIKAMAAAYAQALGRQPWLSVFPAAFHAIRPVMDGRRCLGLDESGHALELDLPAEQAWRLIAIAGGLPLSLFGEWDGRRLRPLSYLAGSRLFLLHG